MGEGGENTKNNVWLLLYMYVMCTVMCVCVCVCVRGTNVLTLMHREPRLFHRDLSEYSCT